MGPSSDDEREDVGSFVVPEASGAAALADLPRVPWSELAHAYGRGVRERTAIDTRTRHPVVVRHGDLEAEFRDLVSDDEEARLDAVGELLFSTLWHQGTIYEATAHAVPFLAAMAADPNVPTRGELVYALSTILGSALADAGSAESQSVLLAFRAADRWMQAARDAGPAPVARFVDLLVKLARERPPMTEQLDDDIENAFVATGFG